MTWQAAVRQWVSTGSGLALARVLWADQGGPRPSSADGPWISLRELAESSGGSDWLVTEVAPLDFADLAIASVSAAANTLTVTAHGLQTGDGPVQLETTGTLPGGLAGDTDYWAIRVDASTLKLAATFLGAVDVPAPLDLSDVGAGTHSIVATDDTRRAGAEITRTVGGTRTATVSIQCFGGASVDANGAAACLKRTIAALQLPTVRAALRAANVGVANALIEPVQNVSAVHQVAGFEPRAVMTAQINVPIVDASETSTVIETVEADGTIGPAPTAT